MRLILANLPSLVASFLRNGHQWSFGYKPQSGHLSLLLFVWFVNSVRQVTLPRSNYFSRYEHIHRNEFHRQLACLCKTMTWIPSLEGVKRAVSHY